MLGDIGLDRSNELGNTVKHAWADALMLGEPTLHIGMLVGRVVVRDGMAIPFRVHGSMSFRKAIQSSLVG